MFLPDQQHLDLLSSAEEYHQQGDVYHTVKVLKLLIKQTPEWLAPHLFLAKVYKSRKEWKAVAHYNKKAVALDPSQQEAWWDLSIAAFANGKLRQAKRIWNKFGWNQKPLESVAAVQILHNGIYEIIWVKPYNPVCGRIISIPHPESDRSFGDFLLFDRNSLGYAIFEHKKIPIYPELHLFKRAFYHTFSAIIVEASEADINLLEKMAKQEGMAFEIWSNATRNRMLDSSPKPEYYSAKNLFNSSNNPESTLIAIAGKRVKQVKQVLRSWEVITLKEVLDLEQHK